MKSPVLPLTVGATISGDVTAGAPLEFGTFFWFTVTVSSCVTKIVVAVNINCKEVLENFLLPLKPEGKHPMGGVACLATGFKYRQLVISDVRDKLIE